MKLSQRYLDHPKSSWPTGSFAINFLTDAGSPRYYLPFP